MFIGFFHKKFAWISLYKWCHRIPKDPGTYFYYIYFIIFILWFCYYSFLNSILYTLYPEWL